MSDVTWDPRKVNERSRERASKVLAALAPEKKLSVRRRVVFFTGSYGVYSILRFILPPLVSAWTCTVGDTTLTVPLNFENYTVSLSGALWLYHGDAAVFSGRRWLTASGGGLTPTSSYTTSGMDRALGPFSSLTVSWAGAPFEWNTSFFCYPNAALLEFKSTWPSGAPSAAGIQPPGTIYKDGAFYNFNVSSAPISHFPSFRLGASSPTSALGHIQWAGEFSFHLNNWGVGLEGYVSGQLGGPTVLHEASWAPGGKARAGVLGPLGGFKDAVSAIVPDPGDPSSPNWRWVFGPHSHFSQLPAGHVARLGFLAPPSNVTGAPATAVFPGDIGITAAVYAFGAALRGAANTTRFAPEADLGVSVLSIWSDNGAVFDGDYWDLHRGEGGATYEALRYALRAAGVPAASLQLDPYWFSRGSPGFKDWLPSEEVFGPGGWDRVLRAGWNTTLYSFFFAPGGSNNFPQFEWATSPPWDNFMGGNAGRVSPRDAQAFYLLLMARCLRWGCVGFEIDFLDMQYLGFPDVLATPGAFEGFLSGLSAAGAAAGVPVQLCMPLPSDVLASVALPGVSNIRASDDDDLEYAGAERWRIGLTSMLFGALDVRPFMDSVWTRSAQPPYKYTQNATELGVAISALSTGPLGLGDGLGATNATLVAAAVAKNGVILKPSLPAVPVDAYFNRGPGGGAALQAARAELWAAPSFIAAAPHPLPRSGLARFLGGRASLPARLRAPLAAFPAVTDCPHWSVLAVDVPAEATLVLRPGDLTPSLARCGAAGYVALQWAPGFSAMGERCAQGAPALSCVTPVLSGGLPIATGAAAPLPGARGGPHNFDILSLAPLQHGGWALLGEVAKFVRVAPVRFPASVAVGGGLETYVVGAPGEEVRVALIAPGSDAGLPSLNTSTVRVESLTFGDAGGVALLRCAGAGASSTCSKTWVS
jgi:hypothetical protein